MITGPITLVLLAVTVLVSWRAFERPRLLDRLILWPPAIDRQKQYARLVTHGFVHADWQHLLFNMITLFFFGGVVETLQTRISGVATFPLFYLSAIVVAILPSWLRHRHDGRYRSLGASGAVSAVLFAYILYNPWAIIFVPIPVPAFLYAAFYIWMSWRMNRLGGDNINHSAHLWGAGYGVLFMIVMEPGIVAHFLARLTSPSFG